MKSLTQEITTRIAEIQSEEHKIQKGMRDQLFEAVEKAYPKETRTSFPLRPSSALKPMRDLYYDLVNWKTPGTIPQNALEPRVKLIFEFGHVTEEILKRVCASTWKLENAQERVKYGEIQLPDNSFMDLEGAIDWTCTFNGLETVLMDAKSIGEYPFKTAPKEDNIAQMQLYMHSTWARTKGINRAQLIYFNKNTCDIKVIEIPYDKELAEKLVLRFQETWKFFLEGMCPPREYLAGIDWRADYSSYRDYDNQEFTSEARSTEKVNTYAPEFKYAKDAVRFHVETYGSKIASYIDTAHYIVYSGGKLILEGVPHAKVKFA
jgi:hypothetical protein